MTRYSTATVRQWLDTLARPPATTPQNSPPRYAINDADAYAQSALWRAYGAVFGAAEGGRNDTLNREAFGLYGLAKAGRLQEAAVTELLTNAAQSVGLMPEEISATLESARARAMPRENGRPGIASTDAATEKREQWAEVIPLHGLHDAAPPLFWTAELLPAGTTTLLGAHGGTGKSFLALQWAVCIAQGRPFFGKATTAGRVLFYSAEDDGARVRHRLRLICNAQGVDPATLADRLLLLDATKIDPSLYAETYNPITRARDYRTTYRYDRLREDAEGFGADVIIIDNASDTYDAEENARARVRSFMRALNVLAREREAAVLLLAHVDKNTAKGGKENSEGYSGSTAWHNSARSRLFMSAKDGALLLEHQKCNLGPLSDPITMAWEDGVIVGNAAAASEGTADYLRDLDLMAVLRLLHEFSERGESVATGPTSPSNARKLLGGQPTYPQALKRGTAVFDLLRDAERAGYVERELYRTPDRKERERWRVTADGMARAGIAPTAPTAPTTEDGALDKVGTVQHGAPAPSAPTGQGV